MSNLPNYRVLNRTRGTVIAEDVEIADCVWTRARGLIGQRSIPNGFGLVIRPCGGIHTLFMSVAIDAVYVDRKGHIVRIMHGIKPWRLGPIAWRCAWVVELPAGTARATGTQLGDTVDLTASAGSEPNLSSGPSLGAIPS